MKIRNLINCMLLSGTLICLNACNGQAEKDGNKSIEGHSDPANNGGALSGDHGMDQASGANDSTKAR